MISWIRGSREARLALAVCAGLLAYRLLMGSARLAFYDRSHGEWRYAWMALTFALLVSAALAAKNYRQIRAKISQFRTPLIVGACAVFVCGVVLIFIADLHHTAERSGPVKLDFSTFTPLPQQAETASPAPARNREKAGLSPNSVHPPKAAVIRDADGHPLTIGPPKNKLAPQPVRQR